MQNSVILFPLQKIIKYDFQHTPSNIDFKENNKKIFTSMRNNSVSKKYIIHALEWSYLESTNKRSKNGEDSDRPLQIIVDTNPLQFYLS